MIKGVKLRRLFEQSQKPDKKGKKRSFNAMFREELGITEGRSGLELDRENRCLSALDVSFGELAYEFLGRDYQNPTTLTEAFALSRQTLNLQEGAGGMVVLPSHFSNINAFVASVGGLIDALVLEAYQSPDFIGDLMTTTDTTQVNGGKAIGARGSGGEAEPLEEGEAAPMNGLKETWIDVPENFRYSEAIAVNNATFIYDRTGQIREAAEFVGTKIGRAKELDIADVVMGITNPFIQDGKAANTYQATATDLPNNYVNTSPNELVDYKDLNDAIQILAHNTDPHTGWEISLGKPTQLLVAPEFEWTARNITRATQIREGSGASSVARQTQVYFPNIEEVAAISVMSSMIWHNRLVAHQGTDPVDDDWYFGNFNRAFNFRLITPFNIQDDPTEVSVRRDILMCRVASLRGRAYVKNPRYAYKGTQE